MKKNILPIFLCLFVTISCFGQFSGRYKVEGGKGNPFLAKEDKDNKIQVYLLNGLDNAKITFESDSPGDHQWFEFSGTNTATPIPSQQTGNTSYITNISDGMGYFVSNAANSPSTKTAYIWIIDYSDKIPVFNSITVSSEDLEDKCDVTSLLIDINARKLQYRTFSGNISTIVRNYKLEYYTMEWDGGRFASLLKEEKVPAPDGVSEFLVSPTPLQNTHFILSEDQFSKHFGIKISKSTIEEFEAIAVNARILMDPEIDSLKVSDNQMTGKEGSISAGTRFVFTAAANEPVATFYQWEVFNMSRNPNQSISRPTTNTLDFTFNDEGQYKITLVVDNRNSSCPYSPDPIEILVSDFMLWVPNAFSPTSSPGVNDIFKVAYKSVTNFKGWIFNTWGNEIFYWTDITQGWDGKYRGKFVPPGTYYYVIEATSADGKKHVKKGDINFVGGR